MKRLMLAILVMALAPWVNAQEVNIYSARQENLIEPILNRFTEQTGIQVNLITGGADELIQRLDLEDDNSPADILLTVDVGRLHRAKQMDLLQPVESEVLRNQVPAQYRDPDNTWFAMSLRSRVIVYNRDTVDPEELSTYEDLASDKWDDSICVRSSSNIYNQSLVASMISHNGVEATEEWANALVDNMARDPQGGDRDQISAVAVGQCDLAIVNSYYLGGMLNSPVEQQREIAEEVALFWPNQQGRGAHMNISGAGLTRSAPNPENGVRLMEFLVSDEAQRWYAETNNEYPIRDDVEVSETLQSWGDFKADQLELEQLGIHNAEAVRLMDRVGWR